MSKNQHTNPSVTRSISIDHDVFVKMEARRMELRLDRSTFIRYVLEDHLGIVKRPLLGTPMGEHKDPRPA